MIARIFDTQARKQSNQEKWKSVDWQDLVNFIGPNSNSFERVFKKQRERIIEGKSGTVLSWSWPVFFVYFAWFAYRKNYITASFLLAFPIILDLIAPNSSGTSGVIVVAMFAKSFHVTRAVDRIAKIKAQYPAGPQRDKAIASAGGISIPGGIIGGVLISLAYLAVIFVLLRDG